MEYVNIAVLLLDGKNITIWEFLKCFLRKITKIENDYFESHLT